MGSGAGEGCPRRSIKLGGGWSTLRESTRIAGGGEDRDGLAVFAESRNSFTLRGMPAAPVGKPGPIARRCGHGTIIKVKTAMPRPFHCVQVKPYTCAVPRATGSTGASASKGGHPRPAEDETFIKNSSQLVLRPSTRGLCGVSPAPASAVSQHFPVSRPERVADDATAWESPRTSQLRRNEGRAGHWEPGPGPVVTNDFATSIE